MSVKYFSLALHLFFVILFIYSGQISGQVSPLIQGLLGSTAMLFLPLILTIFKQSSWLPQLPQLKIGEYILKWTLGTCALWIAFALNHIGIKLPIQDMIILCLVVSGLYDYLQISKTSKINKIKITQTTLIHIVAVLFIYLYYYITSWRGLLPAHTQLTDLYNHNTVANAILRGEFALTPSSLSESLQGNLYITSFHVISATARLVMDSYSLYEFQFVLQFVFIATTYWIFYQFTRYLGAPKLFAIASGILVSIINGQSLSYIRYAPVPNEIVFLLVPAMFVIIDSSNSKQLFRSISLPTVLVGMMHLASSVLLLPLVFIKLKIAPRVEQIMRYLVAILALYVVVIKLTGKLNLSSLLLDTLHRFGLDSQLLQSTALLPAGFYATFAIHVFGYVLWGLLILFCLSLPFRLPMARYGNTYTAILLLFLISQTMLPYADRLFSVGLALLIPLTVVNIAQLKYVRGKHLLQITLFILIIASMVYTTRADYGQEFWSKHNLFTVRRAAALIKEYGIDPRSVYVVAEPMTKMQVESILDIPGTGSYPLSSERRYIDRVLSDETQHCSDSSHTSELIIHNARASQWQNISTHNQESVNVWLQRSDAVSVVEDQVELRICPPY